MNFMTVGDHNYYFTIHQAAKSLLQNQPESKYYVYDWGLKENQISELRNLQNVEIVRWKLEPPSRKESISLYLLNKWTSGSEGLRWKIKRKILKQTPVHKFFRNRQKYLMKQKPLCIKDALNRVSDHLVFLDADAVLINNIDEVFEHEFDIGLTLRPRHDRPEGNESIGVPAINAGVIFFSSSEVETFIDVWIDEMENHDYILEEQVALAELAKQSSENIFEDFYNSGTLSINKQNYRFLTFPCEKYNYYDIDQGVSKDNKILHFKGFDHTRGEYKTLLENQIQ